ELTISFEEELSRYEEERRMPYITSIERLGIQRGIQQGMEQGIQRGSLQTARESVIEVLETRFEEVPSKLRDRLNSINDLALLKQLLKQAITIPSPEEFKQLIALREEES
ncbi:MAG: transposase, partial [Xenococcaceae cyanobacterium]